MTRTRRRRRADDGACCARPDCARHDEPAARRTIDWQRARRATSRGLRIGLLLDAGWGLPVEPEVRAAVEAAAARVRGAGAIVEPLAPFMTRAMADGMDRFWRMRSLARHLGAAAPSAARGAALHRRLGARRRGPARRARCSAATARWRDARRRGRRLRSRSTSCCRRPRRCRPSPPSCRARPTTRRGRSSTSPSRCRTT